MDQKTDVKSVLNKPIGKKGQVKYTTKTGINLARNERREGSARRLGIALAVLVIAVLCLLKFGVIDQSGRLSEAIADYETVHEQNVALQNTVSRYGEVQVEYRSYSMEWTDSADSRFVSVQRQDVLDLVEDIVMPNGAMESLQVYDLTAKVTMSGMTLEEISQMIEELEESPIVASAVLNNAETATEDDTKAASGNDVSFSVTITLQPEGGAAVVETETETETEEVAEQ